MRRGVSGDRGSAAIWVLACCALLVVVASVATLRGLAVLGRHRAESSADLAALAAAERIGFGDDPCAAARKIAGRNGAALRSCTVDLAPDARSGTVVVSVQVRVDVPVVGHKVVVASARAGRLPGRAIG